MSYKDRLDQNAYQRYWYTLNRDYYLRKNKLQKLNTKKFIRRVKKKVGCQNCGYKLHAEALDFDHLGEKEINIACAPTQGWSIKRLKAEMRKCQILCANCHRIKTKIMRNS